jgi:hypothetical protein
MTSRAWYVVAALLFVAGGAGAGWSLWTGIQGVGESIVRILVPGSGEVTLDQPGRYTIFDEKDPVTEGHSGAAPPFNGMTVTITDETDGATVPTRPPGTNMTYSVGGRTGVAVLAFDAAHPGRYRITAAYDNGRTMPKAVLSVDLGLFSRIFRTIGAAFAFGAGGGLSGLVILLVTVFSRQKLRRRAAG